MRIDDPRSITPVVPPQDDTRPVQSDQTRAAQNEAAVNIIRGQISNIYNKPTTQTATVTPSPGLQPATEQVSSTRETETPTANHTAPTTSSRGDWEQYHSAWQNYYQQYYQRYYVGQVHATKQKLEAEASERADQAVLNAQARGMTEEEAMDDLKSQLRQKIDASAKKVRKSKHFWPIVSGLAVMGIFLFLQYNAVIFAAVNAYVSPGNLDPASVIVDASGDAVIGPEPKLIIPKINVEVPIEFNTTTKDKDQMRAMENGVAWFGVLGTSAAAKPGEVGNTVLSGHSSNDIMEQGAYKFIFARLEQMKQDDTIIVNYQSKRYIYTVTSTEVVKPNQVDKLYSPTVTTPTLTLITCTPLGTARNRLLVRAEQVSPDPNTAVAAENKPAAGGAKPETPAEADIPGSTGSIFDRFFGGLFGN